MEASNTSQPTSSRAREAAARPAWTRNGGTRIRVLIVDDHAILRQALRHLLETQSEIEVVGDASSGREAVAEAEKLLPDVVLMDMIMPGLNGLEATRQIRKRAEKAKFRFL